MNTFQAESMEDINRNVFNTYYSRWNMYLNNTLRFYNYQNINNIYNTLIIDNNFIQGLYNYSEEDYNEVVDHLKFLVKSEIDAKNSGRASRPFRTFLINLKMDLNKIWKAMVLPESIVPEYVPEFTRASSADF